MNACFNRFEIVLTKAQAVACSRSGDCEPEVIGLLKMPSIKKQLAKIADKDLTDELAEYGAWNTAELCVRGDNEKRILWIAAGNIADDITS